MGRWLFMLGGLMVWTAHFLGVYAIASAAEVHSRADTPAALWTIGAFTLLCLAADTAIGAAAWRRWREAGEDLERFTGATAMIAAGLSAVAIIWQGLPALVGH